MNLIEIKELQLTPSKLYKSNTWPVKLPKDSQFQSYKIDKLGNVSLFFTDTGKELEDRWFSNNMEHFPNLGFKLICSYEHFYIGACFIQEWNQDQIKEWNLNFKGPLTGNVTIGKVG